MMKEESPTSTALGLERLRCDRRQLGGMLFVMGVCVTFQPLAGNASWIGLNQEASRTSFDSAWLICSVIIQLIFGTLAMVVGYLALVHDYGNRRLTGALLLLTQLSWILFVAGIVQVGIAITPPYITETRMSSDDDIGLLQEYVVNPFVPENYLPNKNDVLFLGFMGILGLITYGIGFFGSLAFLVFALYTFDAGKPTQRTSKYYRGRLLFYSFNILIAGMSQILFGAYVIFEFGRGPLSPAIGVAMYRVSFPEIAMAVGSIQMIVGYFGIGNYLQLFSVGPNENKFQIVAFAAWFLQLILQYIVQIAYNDGGSENSDVLLSLALYSFGMNVLPPFLDYKMRTTPATLNEYYYGMINEDDKINVNVREDLASQETQIRPESCENVNLLGNPQTLEIRSGSEDNADLRESSDSARKLRQNEENNIESKRSSTQRLKRGMLFKLFSSMQAKIFDRGSKVENQQDEKDSTDHTPHLKLNADINESGNDVEETRRNPDESDITLEEKINSLLKSKDTRAASTGSHNEPRIGMEEIEYSGEPGITVEEIAEYPNDSGIRTEQTVEYLDNSGPHANELNVRFLEPGVTVEECVEYPDDFSPNSIFDRRARDEVGEDNGSDQDTPPRSNESFSTDMEDTWGDQLRQQSLLSPIEEEGSRRIIFGETKEKSNEQGQESSPSRGPIDPPQDFNAQDPVEERENPRSKSFIYPPSPVMNPSMPDSYYDYDTDEGFEISVSTPDDDTAALGEKIERLKGELLSDTKNLESYLNKIL